MRNKLTLTSALVAIALAAQPALSQEADGSALVLEGREVTPAMDACQAALELGQILKTDAAGAYHISLQDLYFVISVDETQMTCRMYRHVFRS